MEDAAHRLSVQVRTWAGSNGRGEPADEVLLVGHSIGGLLVRHAYLLDAGLTGEPAHGTYEWTDKVRRIVLLAAPNAGFVTSRLPIWLRPLFATASALGAFTVEQIQAGSTYITELRLRWIDAFNDMQSPPIVVQVLGDRDDIVGRDDSLDVEFMRGATRVDVPGAAHADLVDLGSVGDPNERYAILHHAVRGRMDPDRLSDTGPRSKAPVYFLLHGIRASRYANWVGGLARELKNREPHAVVYSPSYGYFSAVEFALPSTRSRNLRHFLDWYSRLYVTHHAASLNFAGHSNGTYMLGQALLNVPAVHFDRVYLAGSVLPRDYPWSTIVDRKQISEAIHSDRASQDWAVGWLCAALRGLGMHDVGTSGFVGFDQAAPKLFEHDKVFLGNHGAALTGADRLKEVAEFLRAGTPDREPDCEASELFKTIGRIVGVSSMPLLVFALDRTVAWIYRSNASKRIPALAAAALVVWSFGQAL
jgi:hypothetical protein